MAQLSPDGAWRWDGVQWVPAHQPPPYYPPPPPAPTDGLAIASLVCGLVWLGGAGSLAAVITGHLSRAKAHRERREPSGLSLAGLILGYLGLAGTALLFLFTFALGAAISTSFHEAIRSSTTDLALLDAASAEDSYHDLHGTYTDEDRLVAETSYVPLPGVTVTVVSHSETRFCLRAVSGTSDTLYLEGNDEDHDREVTSIPCS